MFTVLLALTDDPIDPRQSDFAVQIIPHRDHRGQPAAAEAMHLLKSEFQVLCRLSTLDPQPSLELLEDLDAALNVASCSHANSDRMFSPGFETESLVESSDTVSSAERDTEAA
jgi:hypothetical protein